MDKHEQIPIWFFIGALLLVYGIIISAVGVWFLFAEHANPALALQNVHADLWWGLILLAIGGIYTIRYCPWRTRK
jgi:hypothetical protein